MKRLLRTLLNGATVLSLVLFAGIAALWARSYLVQDRLAYVVRSPADLRTTLTLFGSLRGKLVLHCTKQTYELRDDFDADDPANTPRLRNLNVPADVVSWPAPSGLTYLPRPAERFPDHDSFWRQRGFYLGFPRRFGPSDFGPPTRDVIWSLGIPHWLPLLIAGLIPLSRLRARLRAARRARRALCPACGYDLRATPDRCPECGARPPARDPVDVLRDMLSYHSGVPALRITGGTRLAEDLRMSGDDAIDFLQDFFRTFDVDARAFVFARYFLGEHFSVGELLEPPRTAVTFDHLLTCIRQNAWTEPAAQRAQQPGTTAPQ